MRLTTLAVTGRRILPVAAAHGLNVRRQSCHARSGHRLSRPNMIYVMIYNACNLRCLYCDIWKNKYVQSSNRAP